MVSDRVLHIDDQVDQRGPLTLGTLTVVVINPANASNFLNVDDDQPKRS